MIICHLQDGFFKSVEVNGVRYERMYVYQYFTNKYSIESWKSNLQKR